MIEKPDPLEPLSAAARTGVEADPPRSGGARSSALVAAGILLSRLAGLVRDRALAAFFGTGMHADVFSAGLRMPNALQNLLGEGTLSASFIPVYSKLLAQGRVEEAGRVAGAVFALLLAIAAAISLAGIALAPLLVSIFTPGFEGERRELMIAVTRIVFPMTGVLVLSAWALGILNSRRKFFVPYFAPVLWNAAIIAALVAFGTRVDLDGLLMAAAWGALIGGLMQFGVQLPWVLRTERKLRFGGLREPGLVETVRNAGPVILGRGAVQIGGYLDMILASLLAAGAFSRLRFAQTLYLLPISLFGMSVAAAALPELARRRPDELGLLRQQAGEAARRVAFYVVPSAVTFVLLGDVIVAGLYQTGAFGAADVTIVWLTLAAYSLGLLASTASRIYQSTFFALQDTKTPARIAAIRVACSGIAGAVLMLQLEPATIAGVNISGGMLTGVTVDGLPLGPVGLALGAALGAWTEWVMLRRRLERRIGRIGPGLASIAKMLGASLAAAAAGHMLRLALDEWHPLPAAIAVSFAFGAVYLGAARALGLSDAGELLRLLRLRR